MHLVKDYLSYLLLTILLVLGYINISVLWVDIRFFKPGLFRTEIPLVAAGLTILYFAKLRNRCSRYLLPVAPIILIYLGFDLFYNNLGRAPRPSDLHTIREVILFSPATGAGILLFMLAPLLPIGLLLWSAARVYPRKKFAKLLLYKTAAAITCTLLLSIALSYDHERWFRYIPQSQKATIRHNGRISSFIYYFWHEKENRKKLLTYAPGNVDIVHTLYPGKPSRRPNIHLIVLESFVDPRMIKGAQFNRSPLAEELQRLIGEKGFAYARIESVEFNVMNGGEVHSFVHQLKANGYRALGTIATGFGYFNSKQAYKSLGLTDVVYLEEMGLPRPGDLNYLLGMYGHMPYDRNPVLRPDIIHATNPENETLNRIANQFYYRTRALAAYLEELLTIDPDSIIYVTSDHLPPIFGQTLRYAGDNYTNIALMLDSGEHIDVSGRHYSPPTPLHHVARIHPASSPL